MLALQVNPLATHSPASLQRFNSGYLACRPTQRAVIINVKGHYQYPLAEIDKERTYSLYLFLPLVTSLLILMVMKQAHSGNCVQLVHKGIRKVRPVYLSGLAHKAWISNDVVVPL